MYNLNDETCLHWGSNRYGYKYIAGHYMISQNYQINCPYDAAECLSYIRGINDGYPYTELFKDIINLSELERILLDIEITKNE